MILLMGVAGAGKSVEGKRLADELDDLERSLRSAGRKLDQESNRKLEPGS